MNTFSPLERTAMTLALIALAFTAWAWLNPISSPFTSSTDASASGCLLTGHGEPMRTDISRDSGKLRTNCSDGSLRYYQVTNHPDGCGIDSSARWISLTPRDADALIACDNGALLYLNSRLGTLDRIGLPSPLPIPAAAAQP